MTDPMELVGRAENFDGAHKRGCELRSWSCTCGDDETAMNLIAQMAACIREMVESQSGGYVPAAPDDQGFVPWSGGENPCPGGRVDAVWLGEIHHDQASDDLEWAHSDICDHITSYRILPPAPGAEA